MWNHNPSQMNAAPRPMQPQMNAPNIGRTLMGMPHHADGGVIGQSQQPGTMDRLSALWHSLFAQNQLKQAAQGTSAPPPSPPPEAQDTSMVARAAADAGRRMEAAKAAQGQPPR